MISSFIMRKKNLFKKIFQIICPHIKLFIWSLSCCALLLTNSLYYIYFIYYRFILLRGSGCELPSDIQSYLCILISCSTARQLNLTWSEHGTGSSSFHGREALSIAVTFQSVLFTWTHISSSNLKVFGEIDIHRGICLDCFL